MPLSGGISGGGGGGYFALTTANRVSGSNAGVGNASDDVFFGGGGAGNGNAGQYNIGIGVNAARQAQTARLIVIGSHAPSNIGINGINNGSVLIGNEIAAAFTPGAPSDLDSTVAIGNEVLQVAAPTGGISRNVIIGWRALNCSTDFHIGFGTALDANVVIGSECGKAISHEGGLGSSVLIGSAVASLPRASGGPNSSLDLSSCVAIGTEAMLKVTATECVAIGVSALSGGFVPFSGIEGYDGLGTTAIGSYSGSALTKGDENTFLGYLTAGTLEVGQFNTIFGARADVFGTQALPSDNNLVIGYTAGNSSIRLNRNVFIGNYSGLGLTVATTDTLALEHVKSAFHAGAVPFLFGELPSGNLMLGNRENVGGALNRLFGTGAINNFKIQEGTAPSTAPDAGVSIYVQNTAGVYSLRCIGPGGVAQVLATGL